MAVINVEDWDNFDQWRQKTNLISQSVGDLDLLDPVFFPILPTNLVDAIKTVEKADVERVAQSILRPENSSIVYYHSKN